MGQEGTGVEQDVAFSACGIRIAMETDPGRSRQFSRDIIVVEVDPMITRFGDFAFMGEGGPVCVHAQVPLERAGCGHDGHAGHLPVVDMAEAADMQGVIQVAGTPGMRRTGVRTQADHAKGKACRVEKEPAGTMRIHEGIDFIHIRILGGCPDASGEGKEDEE